MNKKIIAVAIAVLSTQMFAANVFVRKGATGTGSGADWNNALTELNKITTAKVHCGDTVYVAGGSYTTGLKFSAVCTSATPISIYRALSSDKAATSAPGWSASYDSQVIGKTIDIPGPAAYITISGRTGDNSGQYQYGIKLNITGDGIDGGEGQRDGNSAAIDHITFNHIEIYGPACVSSESCGGYGVVGVNIAPYCGGANRSHLVFENMSIHRTGEAFRACGWDSNIVQYNLIYDTHNDGQQHEDILYANPPYSNNVWRYNKIFMSPNDGMFHEYGSGKESIYGNVFYHSGGELLVYKQGGTYGPLYVYNNVFENDGTFGDYQPAWIDWSGASGGEFANNVMERVYNVSTPPNPNHNAYSLSGESDGGSGSFYYTANGTQFVNENPSYPLSADFHLTPSGASTFGSGKTLPAPYNVDPDGIVRGADGAWEIGAYEY